MTRKHENVSAEYCPKMDTIETIPLFRNRDLGTSQNISKKNFPFLTNCSESMRIFHAIWHKTVSMCDVITPKAEKLTNFWHFRLEISVCIASAVGASENFGHVTGHACQQPVWRICFPQTKLLLASAQQVPRGRQSVMNPFYVEWCWTRTVW